MIGLVALIGILIFVIAAQAAMTSLSLWWLRRQSPSPAPGWPENLRVWTLDCAWSKDHAPHPAHRWRRGAWTVGGTPTSHPNWCPGYTPDVPPR